MSSSNVLVTGGAGYVGAHACKALARAGYVPVVYDNLSTGHEAFVCWGPLIKADIRDHATLREVMLVARYIGCAALRCVRLCWGIGDQPPEILRQQRLGHALAAAGDVGYRCLHHRVLELLRHLRRTGAGPYYRSGGRSSQSTPTAPQNS